MKTLSCIFLFLTIQMFFAIASKAQETDLFEENQRQANKLLQNKIDEITAASIEATELKKKMQPCDKNLAFEAVKSKDPFVIKLLELYAENGISRMIFDRPTLNQMPSIIERLQQQNCDADAALAKEGNTKFLDKIINQTDKSKEDEIRFNAVRKLILIDSKESNAKLYQLLDDTTASKSDGDVQSVPISEYIISILSNTVTNPPNLKKMYETKDRARLWKKWFEENKSF